MPDRMPEGQGMGTPHPLGMGMAPGIGTPTPCRPGVLAGIPPLAGAGDAPRPPVGYTLSMKSGCLVVEK